ncbi:M1 family metallopeptidase [candidate division KSB1 bacterium]|nr:M1 family metallopeptidase [candidate division KSB1 bacterium]
MYYLNYGKMLCCIAVLLISQKVIGQEVPVLFPEPLSPRIANYNIDVTLDAEKRLLDGKEVLVWHNKTGSTIKELQFHLYLNAFRNSKSTFMERSGGSHRGNRIEKDGWGFIDVNSFFLKYHKDQSGPLHLIQPRDALESGVDAIDLTAEMRFIQPDNNNENDKTVFSVPLPKPLPPGESVEIDINFTAKLPSPPFARTGAKEEYFFVGQWFPKIGVYTDKGWNTHQFHETSEFFADFGVYNVRMTVPEANIVGATGVEVSVTKNGDGTATHFYHAEDVHDFAWTTSPEFVEFTGKAQDVDIRVLMQPDHAYQGQRHLDAAKFSVEYFQNWYGDYPFPNLTVVDPRRGAAGSGGMEYPTLITAGTVYGLPEGLRSVEMVILHEFGHNYWYHLLASNEFEESWMDEGINSYTEIQIMQDVFGPVGDSIDLFGIKINIQQGHRMRYINQADRDPMVRRAWEYYSGGSYGTNSYSKPAIVLTTLQNYLGEDLMLKVMREYVTRWRFKHPKTQDFIAVVNDVSGQNLDWFFDQAFFSNALLDYSVTSVRSKKVKKASGFDFDISTTEEKPLLTQEGVETGELVASKDAVATMDLDSATTSPEQDETPEMYFTEVKVRRLGEFRFPVEIEMVFENGETIREQWDGQEIWTKYSYTKPTKLVSATVDPGNKIPIDVNITNNGRTVEKQRLGINKLSARWMFWMQFLLDQPEFMNLFAVMNDIF